MIYLLPQTVLESATKYPDKEAFKCGRDSLTYADLATKIQQLAGVLYRLGVRRGGRVGVYLNRSIETAIALHGIMLAGAAYVPLNPKSPADHTRFQIRDGDFKVAVSNQAQQRNLALLLTENTGLEYLVGCSLEQQSNGPDCITWQEVFAEPAGFSNPQRILSDDLAYIMYTSGSTGRPKGMMHTHRSGLSFAQLMATTFGLNSTDRFGNHAPIYFDISTPGYFTAPLLGASTVIASDAHTIFPGSMSQLVEKESVTVWYSVPLALTQMLEKGKLAERNLNKLRWVFYAGEPFAPKYLRALMECAPTARVANLYGPAETNVCTYYVLPGPPEGDTPIPIGDVWADTDRLILDVDDREVTASGTGELCIRSVTTMQGSWRGPDLTEKGFLKRSTAGGATQLFYRTGDLVRLEDDRLLHFNGRKDNQVKVRGYRVELDAVENRLLAHAGVLEAAVITESGAEGTLRMVAKVILATSTALEAQELLTFVGKQLPWYAVPERIDFMTDFPRTGSGKIDRPALRRMNQNL